MTKCPREESYDRAISPSRFFKKSIAFREFFKYIFNSLDKHRKLAKAVHCTRQREEEREEQSRDYLLTRIWRNLPAEQNRSPTHLPFSLAPVMSTQSLARSSFHLVSSPSSYSHLALLLGHVSGFPSLRLSSTGITTTLGSSDSSLADILNWMDEFLNISVREATGAALPRSLYL